MVVESTLDLGYLGLFLGMRMNELVRERGATRGFADMRDSHGYVIQHLIDKDRTITELAGRMGVSQQAASKFVADLVGRGVIELIPSADRRVKTLRLSKRGWEAVRCARRSRQVLERRLQRAVGRRRYHNAKDVLAMCLRRLGGVSRVRTRRIRLPH